MYQNLHVAFKIPGTNIIIGSKRNGNSTPTYSAKGLYEALVGNWGSNKAGVTVNSETAARLTAVAACFRIISRPLAALPKRIYIEKPDGDKIVNQQHPANKVINNPYQFINRYDFWRIMITNRLARGNAYAYIRRNAYYQPIELIPLAPGSTQPYFVNEKLLYYNFDPRYPSIPNILEPADVFHLRDVNSTNSGYGFEGLSPIAQHANSLGITIASEEYGAKFFGNSAVPVGFLKIPQNINQEQADAYKKAWKERLGGDNQNDIAVLGGSGEFVKISISPEEAQFLETRKYGVQDIARIYDVPPHMLADLDRATFSNIEHLAIEFVKNCLWGYAIEIEEEVNAKLLTEAERNTVCCKFDFTELLQGDANAVADYLGKLINNGIISIDEARLFIGRNKVAGGDKRYLNAALMPIEMIADFYQATINTKNPATRAELLDIIERSTSLKSQQEIIGFRKELDQLLQQKQIQNEHTT